MVGLLLLALLLLQSKISDITHRNQLIDQRLLEQEEWKHKQLGEVPYHPYNPRKRKRAGQP